MVLLPTHMIPVAQGFGTFCVLLSFPTRSMSKFIYRSYDLEVQRREVELRIVSLLNMFNRFLNQAMVIVCSLQPG